MCTDDDIGAVTGLVGGDEVGLQVIGDGLDRYRDALLTAPGLGNLLERVCLLLIRPDDQVGVGPVSGGVRCLRGNTARGCRTRSAA